MSDDLISRQAAIDVVEGGAELIRRVLDNMDVVIGERGKFAYGLGLLESCIEDLSGLPSVQPERWIPISERLPELDEVVLATTAWNDITIAWRIGISAWFVHEGNTNAETDDVIAWMPLPEPYKEEGEE